MTDNLIRMDGDVQYRIPYPLYLKIMKLLGFEQPQICAKGKWIFGDDVRTCLDALYEIGTPETYGLAVDLLDALKTKPEPIDLQEV